MQNRQRAKSHKQPTTYSAFDTAIYYLTFRDRSRKELCDKLAEKGYEEAEIAEAVEKLMSYGYIDDERYASSYIRNQMRAKGRRRITMELSGKGVDSEMTRELCMELVPDEAETIYDLLERRYGNLDFSDEGQMRRMYSFLHGGDLSMRIFAERCQNIEKILKKYRKVIYFFLQFA